MLVGKVIDGTGIISAFDRGGGFVLFGLGLSVLRLGLGHLDIPFGDKSS